MTENFDAVVIGGGVVGASTAFHLAALGGLKVCVVERGQICTGGTARSCAIVRTHYSVATNTALTIETLEMFADFKDHLDDADAESGFVNSGYLILAPEGDVAEKMRSNVAMQAGVGADTFPIAHDEARKLHPLLDLDDIALVGYEPKSGYADPWLTTSSFIRAAQRKGVVVKTDCAVERLIVEGGKVKGVDTARGAIHAPIVVSAIGPWTPPLFAQAGIDVPVEVSRHVVLTFKSAEPYRRDIPVVKDLATDNKMYFRPSTGGVVLVGTGDHGDPIPSPDAMDENAPEDLVLTQGRQIGHRLHGFAEAALTDSWVGAYDITPDWNPILGPVDGVSGLLIATGFSGHGFKLAPAVGKVLAQTALGQAADVPVEPYRLSRFREGKLLTGSYGIGSIS